MPRGVYDRGTKGRKRGPKKNTKGEAVAPELNTFSVEFRAPRSVTLFVKGHSISEAIDTAKQFVNDGGLVKHCSRVVLPGVLIGSTFPDLRGITQVNMDFMPKGSDSNVAWLRPLTRVYPKVKKTSAPKEVDVSYQQNTGHISGWKVSASK